MIAIDDALTIGYTMATSSDENKKEKDNINSIYDKRDKPTQTPLVVSAYCLIKVILKTVEIMATLVHIKVFFSSQYLK